MLGWKGIVTLAAVIASTVLNALYYIPAIQILFDRAPETKEDRKPKRAFVMMTVAILAFLVLQFGLGLFFSRVAEIIGAGLNTLT